MTARGLANFLKSSITVILIKLHTDDAAPPLGFLDYQV